MSARIVRTATTESSFVVLELEQPDPAERPGWRAVAILIDGARIERKDWPACVLASPEHPHVASIQAMVTAARALERPATDEEIAAAGDSNEKEN